MAVLTGVTASLGHVCSFQVTGSEKDAQYNILNVHFPSIGNTLIQGPYRLERAKTGAEDWQVPPGPSYPIAY